MAAKLMYGLHALKSKLQAFPSSVSKVYCLKSIERSFKVQELVRLTSKKKIVIEFLNKKDLESLMKSYKIDRNSVHQNVFAECTNDIQVYDESDLSSLLQKSDLTPLIAIFDGIQDPHNLGACIRTADAVGVNCIIFPKNRSTGITASVQKIASGAIESVVLVAVTNISRVLKYLQSQGIWIIGMAEEAEQYLYNMDLKLPTAVVIGNESSGLRYGTKKSCDYLAKLPMQGSVESLNLSVAMGVTLYEVVRQRYF